MFLRCGVGAAWGQLVSLIWESLLVGFTFSVWRVGVSFQWAPWLDQM
jgi:hypothetical protein